MYRPPSPNVNKLASDFMTWWTSLQPSWWVSNGGGLLKTSGGDLQPICKSGVNSLLSMLTALFFWRCALAPDAQLDAWECAIDDVAWVFEELVNTSM
jgi:hypothetical protein